MNTVYLNHDYVVARVDKLISDIICTNTQITIQQVCDELNKYHHSMAILFDNELDYTSSIKWFLGSCYLVCGNDYQDEVIWDEALTKIFLSTLGFYKYEFTTVVTDFVSQEQRNSKSLLEYMSHYLNSYARVLIVRVDLKIKVEFAHLVNIETFHGFMCDLRDELGRKRGCFKNLRGHAWAIEQGIETGGLHCHLLLIYNGDMHRKDWPLGCSVGRKWIEITDGLGHYYNCNTTEHKNFYKTHGLLGIGMIHKSNELEKDNAERAALYLTRPEKYEQRLKTFLPSMRSFGRGRIP